MLPEHQKWVVKKRWYQKNIKLPRSSHRSSKVSQSVSRGSFNHRQRYGNLIVMNLTSDLCCAGVYVCVNVCVCVRGRGEGGSGGEQGGEVVEEGRSGWIHGRWCSR